MFHAMFPGFPPSAVVVLAGISGSGKSSWIQSELPNTSILSSDAMRGVLTDEEEHQGCSPDAFRVLETLADLRLKYKRRAIIDATNLKRSARNPWLALARKHDVPAVVVWFDTPPEVCARRQLQRDRRVPPEVIARQARALSDLRQNLMGEAWDAIVRVHTGMAGQESSGAIYFETIREWLAPAISPMDGGGVRVNRTEFDVIGDVHGCCDELIELMGRLGWKKNGEGRWRHPDDRFLIFVGDLADRGPNSLGVLEIVEEVVGAGKALLVMGNHDDKLRRWLRGNNVKLTHGLETTTAEFSALEPDALLVLKERYRKLLEAAPIWALADPQPIKGKRFEERVVISHAAWKPSMVRASYGRARSYCLYGPTTGNIVNGLPQRLDWKISYPSSAPFCIVGHTAFDGPVVERNNTMCLDTACVFGGHLSALRWPSREVVQVKARRVYNAKAELHAEPILIDPSKAAELRPAVPGDDGERDEIPHSIKARLASMVQVGPDKRFDLNLGTLMGKLHDKPEEILQLVHEDPKLLKRSPVEGALQRITLANASKLLFSPEYEHQIFAKGLIYLTNPWRIVSVPYLKMYNYGERQDAFELANELAADASITVRFNEKLDGTMIQSFSTVGLDIDVEEVVLTTRGMIEGASFGAAAAEAGMFDYIGQARDILQSQTPKALDPHEVQGRTLLWELIHPGARIVTDYGERRQVVLTGAIDFRTGAPRYIPRDELVALAADLGAPISEEIHLEGDTLADRLEALADIIEGTDKEGAVVTLEGKYADGRPAVIHRVKVKGADYLRLMRLFAYCTYDRTREFLEANPDLKTWEAFRDFLMRQGSAEVPEEVLGTYRAHYNVWRAYQGVCAELVKEASVVYQAHLARNPLPDRASAPEAYRVWRRDFAAWAKENAGALAWLLFALVDDRLDVDFLDRKFRGDASAANDVRDGWRALKF